MRVNGAQQTGQSSRPASGSGADVVVMSSSRGRSDMGGRRPQGVGACLVVTQPVGVPADVQDHGPVKEPVEERGGDGGVSQDLAPGNWNWHTSVIRDLPCDLAFRRYSACRDVRGE